MAQHDYVVDNGPGLAVRTDINAVLQAILTSNSGAVEPGTMAAGMIWLDVSTTPPVLKIRNQANTGWDRVMTGITSMVVTSFMAAGTFPYAKPVGLKFLQVELWGSGGGGGGCGATTATQMAVGGGGGAGGYCRKFYKAGDLAASEPLVIGAGGTRGSGAGVNGGDGTDSTFKGMVAGGGKGGNSGAAFTTVGSATLRGSCGVASGGDFNGGGASGQPGIRFCHGSANTFIAGYGGAGFGKNQFYANPSATFVDFSGTVPDNGCGGNGSSNGFSQAALNGPLGGPGMAVLTEYF